MIDVRQDVKWLDDIKIRFFYGHTEALMAPVIPLSKGELIYCADALPAQWYVGMPYVLSFDIRPLVTLKEKESLFQRAVQKNSILFLEHDPVAEALRITFDQTKKRYLATDISSLSDLLA
jgi:hypothetical protein